MKTNNSSPRGAVVYIDHAHHLTPLTLTYHATASRHLTSGRSDVIPPSTSVEIDSAYCPRCFTYCDAASASTGGVCKKDSGGCKDCPVCFSPVTLSIDKNINTTTHDNHSQLICTYKCGNCQWSSIECGVTSNADKLLEYPTDKEDSTKEKELEKQRSIAIVEISKQLEVCYQQKIEEKNKSGDELFNSITKMWTQREQDEQRRKRMIIGTSSLSTRGTHSSSSSSWSMETLEKSLLEKKKELDSPYIAVEEGSNPVKEEDDKMDESIISKDIPTAQQVAAQMILTTTTPQSRPDLFPLPVPYRARVSRRCRAELAAGRTGILVKPKLNPLEGDTSLRAGHGQWWKKDSSAVHVVPRVQVCQYGTDDSTQQYAALLKVKNPTLSLIRLRFSGVPSETPPVDEGELQNILVDPFTETFVQGVLCNPDATTTLDNTDFIELDAADDPFLDIGKAKEEDPTEVSNWDVTTALDVESNKSHLRIVAAQGDSAWIELKLCNVNQSTEEGKYLAIPFSLQIEVGNGSWEASLIKRRADLSNDEQDLVTLNLVTLLR